MQPCPIDRIHGLSTIVWCLNTRSCSIVVPDSADIGVPVLKTPPNERKAAGAGRTRARHSIPYGAQDGKMMVSRGGCCPCPAYRTVAQRFEMALDIPATVPCCFWSTNVFSGVLCALSKTADTARLVSTRTVLVPVAEIEIVTLGGELGIEMKQFWRRALPGVPRHVQKKRSEIGTSQRQQR